MHQLYERHLELLRDAQQAYRTPYTMQPLGISYPASIANYAYSVDDDYIDQIEDVFADAGASVGLNLIRQSPINFTAAYSDYHVTGLNPASNARLTDAAFVASRFRIVQSKREFS